MIYLLYCFHSCIHYNYIISSKHQLRFKPTLTLPLNLEINSIVVYLWLVNVVCVCMLPKNVLTVQSPNQSWALCTIAHIMILNLSAGWIIWIVTIPIVIMLFHQKFPMTMILQPMMNLVITLTTVMSVLIILFWTMMNDSNHRWNVCLGVPYGTALWQVADSPQQNGKCKILLNKAKRKNFIQRIDSCQQDMHLVCTDIIPLLHKCWCDSLGDVEANKRAITERGGDHTTEIFYYIL